MSNTKRPSKGKQQRKGGDGLPPTPTRHSTTLPPAQPPSKRTARLAPRGKDSKRPQASYTEPQVLEALEAYTEAGTFPGASAATGFPWQTIREWVRSPKWADDLSRIRHAHAREVRARFAGGAAAFADDLKLACGLQIQRLNQIAKAAEAGEDIDGKELARIVASLASSAVHVARIADVVTDPSAYGTPVPAHFRVSLEVPPEGDGKD